MIYLIAAIAGLCVGPLLFGLLHRSERSQLAVDGFVMFAVVGLVAVHVLPEAVEALGAWALFAAGLGLLLPLGIERVRALSHGASHGVVLTVALIGLLLHASIDGVGLGGSDGLALAVVLHRIPVGLGVWWLVRPQFGRGVAMGVIAAICLATVGGYALQTIAVEPHGAAWVHLIQALVAGSLLHVVLHQSVGFHDHGAPDGPRIAGTLGALGGAAVVAFVPDGHGHSWIEHLLGLLLVTAPWVCAVWVAAHALRHRTRDLIGPFFVTALMVSAMIAPVEPDITAAGVAGCIAFGALVFVNLVRTGPRDFLLTVLPLDLLGGAHDHGHEHHGHDAHGHGHDGHLAEAHS